MDTDEQRNNLLKAFEFAKAEIGVQETAGEFATPRIVEYHQSTTLHATSDEIPWCSAFVNFCLAQAGIEGTGSAKAKSFLRWGSENERPRAGDIVVLSRGHDTTKGHVGFLAYDLLDGDEFVNVLGGNQSDQVKVSKFHIADVISFRRI